MKMLRLCLLAVGLLGFDLYAKPVPSSYMQEFKAFKHSPEYERMFAAGANSDVQNIQKDVDIFKALTFSQRLLRFAFMAYDIVLVTPQAMPRLYNFIDTLCKQNSIETPTIFIGLNEGFFNAAASKLFKSTGAIIIGKQMLKETSESALEAILAHEIGHIKHNHVNKILLILAVSVAAGHAMSKLVDKLWVVDRENNSRKTATLMSIEYASIFLLPSILINKRFEKEADTFACENGHAHGVVETFEFFKERSDKADNDIVVISDKIVASKKNVTFTDYLQLKLRLGIVKVKHKFSKAYKWIYHNTPWGPHPSPNARIEAAQEYIATH